MFENAPLTIAGLIALITVVGGVLWAYRVGMAEIGAAEDRAITAVTLAKTAADVELARIRADLTALQLEIVRNYPSAVAVDKMFSRLEASIDKLIARFDTFSVESARMSGKILEKVPNIAVAV